jgi:FkbM family methyltransferase
MTLFNTRITKADLLPPLAEKIWQKIPFGKSKHHPFDAVPAWVEAKMILDVGANEGKVAEAALRTYPNSQIICFEPVAATFHALQQRLAPYGNRVIYFNEALSDCNTKAEINLTNFNGANSLQPQPEFHKANNPHVREIGKEVITLVRLDDVAAKLPTQKIDIMKIDVEGHELKVLQGGREFLRHNVDMVIVEIAMMRDASFAQQAVYEIFALMKELGFALVNVFDLHHDPHSDLLLLQMDCVFTKQTLLKSSR